MIQGGPAFRRARAPQRFLAVSAGNSQSATVATTLPVQPKVRVLDAGGNPVVGARVLWADQADGRVGSGGSSGSSLTDVSGYAVIDWRLSPTAGTNSLIATLALTGGSVTFTATGTADVPAIMEAATAADQSGSVSSAVAVPPAVRVMDQYRNVIAGASVTWAIVLGSGSVVGGGTTDAFGLATVISWTLGPSVGANSLTASSSGLTGSPVTFTASASARIPTQLVLISGGAQTGIVAGQTSGAITVLVKDSGNAGVPNITVGVSASAGTVSNAAPVTDSSGAAAITLTTSTTVGTATVVFQIALADGSILSVSTTIATTFGALAELALLVEPDTNCASGSPLPQQPVVLLRDANHNIRTTDTSTVTASILTGSGSLTGATKAAVAGQAAFTALTVVNVTGGSDLLRFSAGGFHVDAALATTVAAPNATAIRMVTQPSGGNAGSLLNSYSVEVVDAGGVRIQGYTGQVTVTVVAGSGAISGTVTVSCVNGLATFGNTSYSVAESGVKLHFADPAGNLTAVDSSTFTVNPAGTSNRPANASTLIGSVIGWDNNASELGAFPPHAVPGITGLAAGTGNISKATNPLTNVQRTRIRWPGPPNAQQAGVGNCSWTIWPNAEFAVGGVRYGALYARYRQIMMWGNAGVDYENEGTGTKLIFALTGVAANNNFIMLIGTGVDNALQTGMKIEWRQQAVVVNGVPAPPTANRNISQNNGFAGQPLFTVGVPHDLEYYIECNTLASVSGTTGNGKLRVWLDGNLIITKDDMQFRNSTHSGHIGGHKWNPTWGGSGGSKTRDDDLYYEDVEIYGDLTLQS